LNLAIAVKLFDGEVSIGVSWLTTVTNDRWKFIVDFVEID